MPIVKRHLQLRFFITLMALLPSYAVTASAYVKYSASTVFYYKDPKSLYPSGQSTLNHLQKNLISDAYFSSEKESEFYLYGKQKISKNLIKPTFAAELSKTDKYTDIGFFMTTKKSSLKSAPHAEAKTLAEVEALAQLNPLGYNNGFVQVEYPIKGKKTKGFIDITNTISKFDFARAVFVGTSWEYVKERAFDQIILKSGRSVHLSQVRAIYTNDNIGIITEEQKHLPIWSKVVREKTTPIQWRKSRIKGHGIVWWTESDQQKNQKTVSIDDILKAEIYSVSFHPKNPKKAIASTTFGVLITTDGQNWSELSQFKNYKGPVLYYSDQLIYVGMYRSLDFGKTFDNYLNIKNIAKMIKTSHGKQPTSIKIKSLQSMPGLKLLVELDTDTSNKLIRLKSPIYKNSWNIVAAY